MTTSVHPSLSAHLHSLEPRPNLADWMEREMIIPARYGTPGPLRLDGWQRDIASRVGDPNVTHIALQLPGQTFKSLFMSGALMYGASFDIPSILAFPTGVLKDRFVENRLELLAESCPTFAKAIRRTNQGTVHDDGIRLRSGGMIPLATGGAAGQMEQVEASLIMVDELDRFYDDPTDTLEVRGNSMPWFNLIAASTPTLEGQSLIEFRYGLSNRCVIFVTCPLCQYATPLEYLEEHPDAVWCQSCAVAWGDEHQAEVLATARWEPQAKHITDYLGFQTSLLVNPRKPWSDTLARRQRMKPKEFKTLILAECFTSDAEKPPEELAHLFRPVTEWEAEARPVRMLIVDVQRRKGGTLVVWRGDVYGTEVEPKIAIIWQRELLRGEREWMGLFQELKALYQQERPHLMLVDCGDYGNINVIEYVEALFPLECARGTVRHIRGDGQSHERLWGQEPAVKGEWTIEDEKHRHKTLVLNVNGIKARLMFMLHNDLVLLPSPRGDYPANILDQLGSEKLIHKPTRGEPRQEWVKVKSGRENETWDCSGYALGGLAYLGPEFVAYMNASPNMTRINSLWPKADKPPGGNAEPEPEAGPRRRRRVDRYLNRG